jgi:GntR family transcriptional regulator
MTARSATERTICSYRSAVDGVSPAFMVGEYTSSLSQYASTFRTASIESVTDEHNKATWLDGFELSIDRNAEVPIGVQLAWALRAHIDDGRFKPGQRIPALRDLADATGVNVNTIRAVYQRLHREGLIESQQGSGTFVAPTRRTSSDVAAIAATAAQTAREIGVDPREVAAALYVSRESTAQLAGGATGRRRLLRKQIAVLERAIGEIESEHPGVAPRSTPARSGVGPALPSTEELEQVRSQLMRRLATVQGAIDQLTQVDDEPISTAGKKRAADRKTTTKPKRAPRPRAATRPATARA